MAMDCKMVFAKRRRSHRRAILLGPAGVLLAIGGLLLAGHGCFQPKPDPHRFRMERLADKEAGLAKAPAIYPLRFERKAVGKGDWLPAIVLEVDEKKVRLTTLETNEEKIVTYESDPDKAGLAQVLAGYKPEDFRGAYRISDLYIRDGGTTTLTTPSAHYVFYLWNEAEIPPEFARFGPLLKAEKEAFLKRKDWRVIRTEPYSMKPRR